MMMKINSVLFMLAMIIAALSFTACGGSDDEEEKGGLDFPFGEGQVTIQFG